MKPKIFKCRYNVAIIIDNYFQFASYLSTPRLMLKIKTVDVFWSDLYIFFHKKSLGSFSVEEQLTRIFNSHANAFVIKKI